MRHHGPHSGTAATRPESWGRARGRSRLGFGCTHSAPLASASMDGDPSKGETFWGSRHLGTSEHLSWQLALRAFSTVAFFLGRPPFSVSLDVGSDGDCVSSSLAHGLESLTKETLGDQPPSLSSDTSSGHQLKGSLGAGRGHHAILLKSSDYLLIRRRGREGWIKNSHHPCKGQGGRGRWDNIHFVKLILCQ